jgi:hypothetical protein
MKFSQVVSIVNPQYVFLKLKPNNSIRNQSTHLIASAISTLYKNVFQSITAEEKKIIKLLGKEFLLGTKYQFQVRSKLAYYIYIEKKKIEFYFIIPKQYVSILREKIIAVWKNITIEVIADIPKFGDKASKYQLVYEKEDAMSLRIDRRDNDLLQSNLNIVDVLEEGDKVGIFYNFMPSNQGSFRYSHKATLEKLNKGFPVDRNKMGLGYIFKLGIGIVDGLVKDVSEVLAGTTEKGNETWLESIVTRLQGGQNKAKESTENKIKHQIIPTQIILLSESASKLRELNNGRSLANSFEVISEDNRLVPKILSRKCDLLKYNLGAEVNKISDLECQNFISIAGRELLERHNFIEKVETQETQVPEDLRNGVMRMGENIFRGMKQKAYLSTHKEYQYLSLFLVGPTRSGKTTLIGNLSYDAITNGECVILFDYIENCEMSTEVSALFPSDKVLNIECHNREKAQGLGYNEVKISIDPFEQYTNAKLQTSQLLDLLNAVNSEDKQLAPKMERYLESAANVVFISGGSIKNVFEVLTNHSKRALFIRKVKTNQMEYLEESLESLSELDDRDKEGAIVGTKLHSIVGIIDRLGKLKRNPYMELMLQKSTHNNIDLVEEMEKNQLICIKMPEDMFNTDNERDIYTTYWITKIWLALQIRASQIRDKDKRKKVNLFIDELYQVENTEAFLSTKLSRLAKFRLKPIVSCHYLKQLKYMRKELSGANASFCLISGCDKDNFNELKDELYPFVVEDLLALPEHHAINYLKNDNGYGKFITKLPPPVSKMVVVK